LLRWWGRSGAVCTCSPERRIHHDAEVVSGTTATGMVAPDGGAPRGSWGQQPSWGRTPSWGSGPGDVHWGWGPPASGRRAFHSGASPGHTPGLSPFTHSLTLCTHSRRGRLGVTWSTRTRGSRLDATRALPLGRLRRGGAGKLAPRRQRRQLSSPRRGPERGRAGPSGAERRRAAPSGAAPCARLVRPRLRSGAGRRHGSGARPGTGPGCGCGRLLRAAFNADPCICRICLHQLMKNRPR